MKNFTFVTDCAATMSRIAGASVSSTRVPYTENWVGFIAHQLNTGMKHVMSSEENVKRPIHDDPVRVKTIVRVFKHGNWNQFLPDGYALLQEVETRFGTTNTAVQQFLESFHLLSDIISPKAPNSAVDAFDKLLKEAQGEGGAVFPALKAINKVFRPVRHIQTLLESFKEPTMQSILPALCLLKREMRNFRDATAAETQSFSVSHPLTVKLAASMLYELEKIETHGLWIAGSLLHPV